VARDALAASSVGASRVFGLRPTKRFSIATSPAASSFVRWLERLPFVSPVARCTNRNSASLAEERTVRIARRPGSWMSRSSARSGPGIGRRPERVQERAVVEDAGQRDRDPGEQQTRVRGVGAVPDRERAGDEQRAEDHDVVRAQAR
jgi:hypothetical protein